MTLAEFSWFAFCFIVSKIWYLRRRLSSLSSVCRPHRLLCPLLKTAHEDKKDIEDMITNRGHGGLCAKIKFIFCFHMVANVQNLPRLSRRWQNFLVMIFCFSVFFVRRFSLTLDCGTPVPLCFYSGAVHLLHLKCN